MIADSAADLLEQPTRARIVEHLRLLPGDHFRSIVRTLQLSLGTARHHLAVLGKSGLVFSEKIGGKLRYFAVVKGSASPMNETFKQYWKYRDLRARVWSTVLRETEARPSSVAERLGVSRQVAAYHLSCLTELGLVVRSHGRYRAVDLDDHGRSGTRAAGAIGIGLALRSANISASPGPIRFGAATRMSQGAASRPVKGETPGPANR
jgi:predicted transcriptional regulator